MAQSHAEPNPLCPWRLDDAQRPASALWNGTGWIGAGPDARLEPQADTGSTAIAVFSRDLEKRISAETYRTQLNGCSKSKSRENSGAHTDKPACTCATCSREPSHPRNF